MFACVDEGDTYWTCGHVSGLHCLKLGKLLRAHAVHHVITTHGHAPGQIVAHLLCLSHHSLMLSLRLYRLQPLLLHMLGCDCRYTLAPGILPIGLARAGRDSQFIWPGC